jgi:IPT/TIG domain
MKLWIALLSIPLLLLLATPTVALATDDNPGPMPLIKILNPLKVKPGEVVTATGENLGANCVAEVTISPAENVELRVEIVEQTDTVLKFKVPAHVSDGKYSVTVLTARTIPVLFIQPVVLKVQH